jgi:hypothetical protein
MFEHAKNLAQSCTQPVVSTLKALVSFRFFFSIEPFLYHYSQFSVIAKARIESGKTTAKMKKKRVAFIAPENVSGRK